MNRFDTRPTLFALSLAAAGSLAPLSAVAEEPAATSTLFGGTPSMQLRYRYENVDDAQVPADEAEASTLRATFGWQSAGWHGLSVFGEVEHVGRVGPDRYKEGPGPVDAEDAGRYPVIADADGTEINQAYLKWNAIDWLTVKAGRQIITYRDAPFHRYIGTVAWRQNWQTQDGVTVAATPVEGLKLHYGWVNQVNRIFGDDAPEPFDRFECDCNYLNAQYQVTPALKLEAYGYLLDIENASANSTDTLGLRANGAVPLAEGFKLLYAAEYAAQEDADGNPLPVDHDYWLGELGLGAKLPFAWLPALTLKANYEVLEGDGTTAFQTPIATLHAYQGWADRFLVTPRDGITDAYLTAIAPLAGGNLVLSYHVYESDHLDYEYGEEFDLQYEYKLAGHWTLGAKAAFYEADRNALALARAGGDQNHDVDKYWLWVQYDF